jgi:hypothetical protein
MCCSGCLSYSLVHDLFHDIKEIDIFQQIGLGLDAALRRTVL